MPKNALLLRNPGMVLVITFVILSLVNAVVFLVGNSFAPQLIVLGTMSLTASWAVFLSSVALSLIGTFALPFLHEWENRRGRMLSPMEMMMAYFVINVVGLWLVARVADILGLGIASWMIVVVLALVLDILQGVAMVALEKIRKG